MDARWLAGLVVLGACFSPSSAPDGGTGSNPGGDGDGGVGSNGNSGKITASWTLTTVAGGTGTCPSDTPTMKVTVTALDSSGTEDGAPNIALFDCTAGSGAVDVPHTMDGQDTGTVHVRWDLTDSTGDTVTATDLLTQISAQDVIDTAQSRATTTSFLIDGAYAWVEWELDDASGTAFTSCDDANVDSVKLSLDPGGGSAVVTSTLACDGDNGRTGGFATQGESSVGGALAAVPIADYSVDAVPLRAGSPVGDTTTQVQLFLDTINGVSPTPQQLAITVTN